MMATAVYILWVAAGQNVWNERHYIPVIPAVAVAVAPLARLSPKTVAAGALALALSIAVNYADRGASTPPVERMRAWLEADRGVDTIVYCGNAERFFDRYPARVAVRSVPSYTELDYRMKTELGPPVRALVCDDIPGFSSTSAPVAVFEARPGDPVDRPLGLYELDGVWPDKAAKGESTSRTPETGA